MLLEEIGYVVETVSIFGRTTAVVHAVVNCYAPTIIQTYDTPSLFYVSIRFFCGLVICRNYWFLKTNPSASV